MMNNFKKTTQSFVVICGSVFMLVSCADTKKQEKDALSEVIKIHDEAMVTDEKLMHNKILLDSLLKAKAIPDVKGSVTELSKDLDAADKAMEDWMHQFEVEHPGKSHEQIMQYMADQKKQIDQVNKQLSEAVKQSNQFISTIKQ